MHCSIDVKIKADQYS